MRTRFLATFGVALFVGGLVSAVSVRPLSLQELCAGAQEIVYAKVESVESYWNDRKIETRVTLKSHETWKGAAASTVVVTVPGGTVGDITMRCSEAAIFHEKDDVVCFLRPKGQSREVYGWFRGQYTVVNGKVREMQDMSLASLRASVQTMTTVLPEGGR